MTKAIEILKSCGFTNPEESLRLGTEVIEENEMDAWLADWNEQTGDSITTDDIKEGKVTDMEYIRYTDNEYYYIVEAH